MRFLPVILCAAVLFAACGGRTQNPRPKPLTVSERRIQLPQVPDSLRLPGERADFIAAHYWDGVDFRDTLLVRDSEFMERSFVNFAEVLSYAGPSAAESASRALMNRAERDRESYMILAGLAEKYFFEPNSPMLNEDFYRWFVDAVLESAVADSLERLRYEYHDDILRRNMKGTEAADFVYKTREGICSSLRGTETEGDLLLIFYDPECGHCDGILRVLAEDSMLCRAVETGDLSVLAVYAGGNEELWRVSSRGLPDGWTVAVESGDIERDGRYSLRAMPTLYLLDADKRVKLKDISLQVFVEYVHGGGLSGVDKK